MSMRFLFILCAAALTVLGLDLACGGSAPAPAPAPAGQPPPSGPPPPADPSPRPAPVVLEAFRPAFGMEGTPVTLSGQGFTGDSKVLFGDTPAGTVRTVSETTLETVVPGNLAPSTLTITVLPPAGPPVRAGAVFTVVPNSLPILDPPPATTVAAGARLVLTGAHFAEPMAVCFGGVRAMDVRVDSPGQITVTVPPGAADGPVTVRNPAGEGHPSVPLTIVKRPGPPASPVLDRFHPLSGPAGTVVTIRGSGFSGAIGVDFGGRRPRPPNWWMTMKSGPWSRPGRSPARSR